MIRKEGLQALSGRASRSNLSFDTRYYEGKDVAVVVTVKEPGETIDDLLKFQEAFGCGHLFVGYNGKTVWDALGKDAIEITRELIPILEQNHIGEAPTKLRFARRVLKEWDARWPKGIIEENSDAQRILQEESAEHEESLTKDLHIRRRL